MTRQIRSIKLDVAEPQGEWYIQISLGDYFWYIPGEMKRIFMISEFLQFEKNVPHLIFKPDGQLFRKVENLWDKSELQAILGKG